MIYLDTSAFIKLYLREPGSEIVHQAVISQDHPLPVWSLLELEFVNTLRFKVFLKELSTEKAEQLISLFQDRRHAGYYFYPHVDPISFHEQALRTSQHTPTLGSRSLDIQHIAAAKLMSASRYITADHRQAPLAKAEGLSVLEV